MHLMSMGQLLKGNMHLQGDEKALTFLDKMDNKALVKAVLNLLQSDTIYWVNSMIVTGEDLVALMSLYVSDYKIWHRRLRHPSDQVLDKLWDNSINFPSTLKIPKNPLVIS